MYCTFRIPAFVLIALVVVQGRQLVQVVSADGQPNIVVMLADDLGYGDLACYGEPNIKTPHLDRLASEGVRLTHCYAAAANCSPARTGLMTGRTPYRAGIHNWIPMDSPMHLGRSEITLATLLRNHGYATAHTGKWHLNGRFNLSDQPQPGDHGFDYWFSTQNNALPNHANPDNFVRNGKPVGKLEGYSGPLVAHEADHWLRKVRDKSKPFFLYVCFHEPHEPIATAPRWRDMYPGFDHPSQAAHHGNVTQLDDAVGRVMNSLDELQLRDNTLVFFTSDNGPAITNWHPHGSAGPLRGKKGELYEGGIRVPGIIRWPGHTRAGTECDEPLSGVDLLPTICQIVGIPLPSDRAIDGASLLPIFDGKPIRRTRPLYWQFNYAAGEPKVAMRDGDWKILAHLSEPGVKSTSDLLPANMEIIKSAELVSFELYNLRQDVAETTDLAQQEPQRLQAMSEKLRQLYREVRQECVTWPAWQWSRYESTRIKWPDWEPVRNPTGPKAGSGKPAGGRSKTG